VEAEMKYEQGAEVRAAIKGEPRAWVEDTSMMKAEETKEGRRLE
jgi:hypothetical protein